jgi:outer membrane protein
LRSDVLQAQAALAQARYNLASDQNARINSREQLNYQLARDVDTDFAVEVLPPVEQDEMSLADARATALKQRPELREARLQEQKADLAIRQEKSTYIPEIDAQFTYLSFQNISFLPQNAATLGLSRSALLIHPSGKSRVESRVQVGWHRGSDR